jgi:RHS repeat-associated protein
MRLAVIDSSNAAFDVDFGYDGMEMVLEGLSSSRTRRYVYGPGGDEPLVGYLVTSTGTSRLWYQADERGSITRLGTGKYDEYGVGGTSRFRYTGQYWLGEANLLYYRARIYDARLGRFLQPDPIGYGDGMNMYAYVKGDPVNFSDPTGLDGDVIEPDIIVTARKPIIVQIIDSGAMGAASAGLRSVGGTVEAAPGGRRVGKPKARPKPKNEREPCTPTGAQMQDSGRVTFTANETSVHGIVGATVTVGHFGTQSGIEGSFTSIGFGFGVGLGNANIVGFSKSLSTFIGGNDTMSVRGFGLVNAQRSSDFDGNTVGGSIDISSQSGGLKGLLGELGMLGADASVGMSNTEISDVTCPTQ